MKILYLSSEAAPFCKTGGLGDVAGSLPRAIANMGAQVRVVLPLYESVSDEYRRRMTRVGSVNVRLSWRNQSCGIYSIEHNGILYYFLDNEYYFRRRELYGHYDDGERFAFFSKAALDFLPAVDFIPDIVHANDWETALAPIYMNLGYAHHLADAKSVFTIHNIQYQGRFNRDFLGDVAGIDDIYFRNGILAYDDGVNLMKGAIVCADYLTTVSRSYASEIQTEYYGHGLDAILRDNAAKLRGVVNGIDVNEINPATDTRIFKNYDSSSIEGKQANKSELLTMLGLKNDTTVPIVSIISRLTDHKGIDLIGEVFDRIMSERLYLIVLGRGDWRYEQMFEQMKRRYPGKTSVNLLFSSDLANKIYAGSDMILIPSKSEPCGLTQLIGMRYGVVPIVRETGGLKDTVFPCGDDCREGLGFTFATYNAYDMLEAIRRSLRAYSDGEKWSGLVRRCMEADNSWGVSAAEYMNIYNDLKRRG